MIILRTWRSSLTHVPESALENLCAALAPSLRALVRPALQAQAEILGVTPDLIRKPTQISSNLLADPRRRTIDGEVFTDGSSLFVVEISHPDSAGTRTAMALWNEQRHLLLENEDKGEPNIALRLSFYYIGMQLDHPQLRQVEEAINATFSVSLTIAPFVSSKFNELRDEGRAPPTPPSVKESEAARALSDRSTRSLAQAIKSSGGLLVRDLAKQLPPEARDKTDVIRRTLESTGLIDAELVIICKKSQAQIARIPSREALQQMSEQGLRCACGKPVSDESVEEAVATTDLGRGLLDGSRWLTLCLLEQLQQIGVPLNDTLIEQQVGGDEVDCLAVVSGEFVFFELKDKDFNLGNAYSFGAKMGILRPDHAVILSTQKIGADAREHFERAHLARNPRKEMFPNDENAELYYIEGLEKLPAELQKFAGRIYRKDAVGIFLECSDLPPLTQDRCYRL